MRTLDEIVTAVRTRDRFSEDELFYAVVAFDVLLSQLELDKDPVRLQKYFIAAEMSPEDYAGPANDPFNDEVLAWYKTMNNIQYVEENNDDAPN